MYKNFKTSDFHGKYSLRHVPLWPTVSVALLVVVVCWSIGWFIRQPWKQTSLISNGSLHKKSYDFSRAKSHKINLPFDCIMHKSMNDNRKRSSSFFSFFHARARIRSVYRWLKVYLCISKAFLCARIKSTRSKGPPPPIIGSPTIYWDIWDNSVLPINLRS